MTALARALLAAMMLAAPAGAQIVVPIDVSNNHVYVRTEVAGRPLDFLLDTGAPSSYFDLGVARSLGLRERSRFTAHGAGAGVVDAAQLEGATIALGSSGITHPVAAAIDFAGITPREGRRIDGVLGADFIGRFVVAIDYLHRELRLHDRDGFTYAGPGREVPLRLSNGYPFVDAELTLADGTRVPARMLVDVGGSGALSLAKPFIESRAIAGARRGPTVRRRGGSGVGGATWADVGRVASLRLGGIEVPRPLAHFYGDSAGVFSRGGSDGTIGGEVLRRFTVYVDYGRKRFVFEPHAETAQPFEADMSGLTLVSDASLAGVMVDEVVAGSPAAEAGLAAGDTLVSIDGQPARGTDVLALRLRLRREGERVALGLRRGGETREAVLMTRRVVP